MSPATISPFSDIKAITCDVFGTVVDWRSSVTEELYMRAHRKLSGDIADELKSRLRDMDEAAWERFAQEWRKTYGAFTSSFDPATDPWKTVDEHHRESLVKLLDSWQLTGLYTDAEIDSLSLVWHRLRPWTDSAEGLLMIGAYVTTATLSNGNVSLLQDLDDFGDLRFQKLFSAEMFRAYKPTPATYLGAVKELGLEPGQVAMVAAHLKDLEAARGCGLRTIYVERAGEEAWPRDGEDWERAKDWVDMWVTEEEEGFVEVARRLEGVR